MMFLHKNVYLLQKFANARSPTIESTAQKCIPVKTTFLTQKFANARSALALRDIWQSPLVRQLKTPWKEVKLEGESIRDMRTTAKISHFWSVFVTFGCFRSVVFTKTHHSLTGESWYSAPAELYFLKVVQIVFLKVVQIVFF